MKELFEAHARYERAMADIKSFNLPDGVMEQYAKHLELLTDHMELCAFAAGLLRCDMEKFHIPAEAAPNAINNTQA